MTAPLPPNEDLRMEVLHRHSLLDTAPEERFDRLARMAARIFGTPVALVSLVDESRQWFKACFGMHIRQTDRKLAFCGYTILSDEVLVVKNALEDPRFCDNALVTGAPGIRFYAGAPLRTKEGVSLGSLCVIDFIPRTFSARDCATLQDLAAMVLDELELREKTAQMEAEIARRDQAEAELKEAREAMRLINEELKESERHLNALLDNAPAIIYSKDLEGRHLLANRPFEDLPGMPKGAIVGRFDHEIFPPELASMFRQNDLAVISAGRSMEFEEVLTVNGEPHVFHSVKFPLRDDRGEIYAISGMSMDITERKKAEEDLREVHARKAAILEASLDAIITIDHNGHVVEVNSAAEQIFGYSVAEMVGREMAELIVPPGLREMHREGLGRMLHGGEGRVLGKLVELPGMRADGSELPLEVAIIRISRQGQPMFTGYIRDITARKQAQQALEDSQARYERMAANMPGMVYQFILHPDGASRFIFASEGCRDVLRMEPADLVEAGVNWHQCVFLQDLEALQESILLSARSLEPWHWEGRIELPTGGIAWIKGMARPNREANGDIVWDGFVFDITERKKDEQALLQSRDEAERANRAKSEFLSRMSHELRTPLNAILGFGQLLERARLQGRQAESASQITRAGRHLLALINEVLDLSRIEAGSMSCSPEPVNAAELIKEALTLIKPLAEKRGIRMFTPVGKECWAIADQQRLRQVLLNLLSNAVKYNKEGGTVEVRCLDENTKQVIITITDTGAGIAPDKIERAFTPFERLGAEGTEIEGCGIGLALSKRLLEMMGGSLDVQSQFGQGTTFTIRLPEALGPRRHSSSLAVTPLTSSEREFIGKRHPLLYVEDNPTNLRLMERIMEERRDVLLHTCERGDEALSAIQLHRPCLILLDLHLPGLTGEQVLRSLRRAPETRSVPVVIISADAMSSQVKHLLAAGANEYITKPLNVGEVLHVLTKYLPSSH